MNPRKDARDSPWLWPTLSVLLIAAVVALGAWSAIFYNDSSDTLCIG